MKKLIIALAALSVSLAAYGQGQFVFNNRVPPDITAKFVLSDGTVPAGDAYSVQLLGGPTGGALAPIGATTFRTGNAAGYVNPLTVTVPGETTTADVQLQIFSGATPSGTAYGTLDKTFSVPVAVAPNPPPNMPLGTSDLTFTVVPEPSTLALGVLGLGALLAIRRRK